LVHDARRSAFFGKSRIFVPSTTLKVAYVPLNPDFPKKRAQMHTTGHELSHAVTGRGLAGVLQPTNVEPVGFRQGAGDGLGRRQCDEPTTTVRDWRARLPCGTGGRAGLAGDYLSGRRPPAVRSPRGGGTAPPK
jgi:hypothetical protein